MSEPTTQPVATPATRLHEALVGRAPRGGVGSGKLSLLTSAISVAQMALFAVGPEGAIAAAGLGVLELCFGNDPQQPVNLPKEINDLVVQDFADDNVRANFAKIFSYASWLADQNGYAMSPDSKYTGSLDAVKDYVKNACDPNFPLRQAITDLQTGNYPSDPPFPVLGLSVFAFGAALHLLMEKDRLLFLTDATTFKSPWTYNIVNAAKRYLDYLNKVVSTINKTFDDRIRAIAPPTAGEFMEYAGDRAVARPYVYIVDHAAEQFPPQEIKKPSTGAPGGGWNYPDDIVWYSICGSKGLLDRPHCDDSDVAQGSVWRSNYIIELEARFQEKYNYSLDRQAELAAYRAAIVDIIETYGPLAPPPKPTQG